MDINNFIIEYWKNIASQNEMELKNSFMKMHAFAGIIRTSNLVFQNFCEPIVNILVIGAERLNG
jgi:hypothetical protein